MDFVKSSLLDDFDIPVVTHNAIKEQLIKIGKSHTIKKTQNLKDLPLTERLKLIEKEVYKVLGRYKGFVKIIYDAETLERYIDRAVSIGCLAFDTETNNSLDPLTCKLMGICLYIPNTKPVYVPINHCKPGTEELLSNQVSEIDAKRILSKLTKDNCKLIYHNGKFDIRVIKNTLGIYLPIWWDTMLAAQLLDENEKAGLKFQFPLHIDPTISSYNIEKLFAGIPYAWVNPEIFALYAAIDSYDTYKLQQYQENIFEQEHLDKMKSLFLNIEVPVTQVVAQMEDNGITLDINFVEKLNKKYTAILNGAIDELNNLLVPYEQTIKHLQNLGELDIPVNYSSSQQLQKVLYDVMQTPQIEGVGKSTDKSTLKQLDTPFTRAILKQRHYEKLITSFMSPLPLLVAKDGKIHASFNQMGTEDNGVRTGRFSCIAKGQKVQVIGGEKNIEDVQIGDYVYCYDDNGVIQLSKVLNKFNNGVKKCVKINWQSTGTHKSGELICTPEHLIRLKNGDWVRADNLHRFDKMSHIRRGLDTVHNRPRIYGSNKFCKLEQEIIKYSIFECDDSKMCVHHIDGNTMNNQIDNLKILSNKEHTKLHSEELFKQGRLNTHSFCDSKYSFKKLASLRNTILKRRTREDIEQMLLQCDCKLTHCNHDFETVKHWIKLYDIDIIALKEKCAGLDYDSFSKTYFDCNGSITKISEKLHIGSRKCNEYIKKYDLCMNHMVQSIKDAGYYEVYDLEIETYHNFIVSEICVHNCTKPNLQQIPSHEKTVRLMFEASTEYNNRQINDNIIQLKGWEEIETVDGWKFVSKLIIGDIIKTNYTNLKLIDVRQMNSEYILKFNII